MYRCVAAGHQLRCLLRPAPHDDDDDTQMVRDHVGHARGFSAPPPFLIYTGINSVSSGPAAVKSQKWSHIPKFTEVGSRSERQRTRPTRPGAGAQVPAQAPRPRPQLHPRPSLQCYGARTRKGQTRRQPRHTHTRGAPLRPSWPHPSAGPGTAGPAHRAFPLGRHIGHSRIRRSPGCRILLTSLCKPQSDSSPWRSISLHLGGSRALIRVRVPFATLLARDARSAREDSAWLCRARRSIRCSMPPHDRGGKQHPLLLRLGGRTSNNKLLASLQPRQTIARRGTI